MDTDLSQPFKLCFHTLKALGFWQDGNQTWSYFVFGYLLHFFIYGCYIIGQTLNFSHIENLQDWVDIIRMYFIYWTLTAKCFNFYIKIKKIKKCYKTLECILEETKDFGSRQHTRKRANQIFKIHKIFWACSGLFCLSALVAVVVSHEMPYKLWFPFDTKTSEIGFWVASLYLVTNTFIASAMCVLFDIYPLVFICFAIGLVDELAERLNEVKTNDELVKCIKIHIKIKEFVAEILENFAVILFIMALMSSTELCVSAFLLSTVSHNLFVFRNSLKLSFKGI